MTATAGEIAPLVASLERRTGAAPAGAAGIGASADRIRDWRLFWAARTASKVGVKDRARAGVHAPLTVGRSFALDYLVQWDDGRISSGGAEKIALADPERLLRTARETAYDDPDGANFLGPIDPPPVPLFSADLDREARSGGGRSFAPLLDAAEARADEHGFKTWSGSLSAVTSRAGVVTSRGLSVASESTLGGYGAWFEGLTGDGLSRREPIDPREASARLARACDLVAHLLSPEPAFASGTMRVLLHPDVVESLVFHYLIANLDGQRIFHGQGAFRIEQFGDRQSVLSPALSLRLEPNVPMDPGSFRFTSEGVPARPAVYVDEGRLVAPILDLKYARRMRRDPVPAPAGADSLRLEGPPAVASEEAVKAAARGVLVLSLLGLHTQDATRGDFSVSAPQTIAVRGGALGGAVKAVLTGNFFEVLRDPKLALVRFEGFRTPGLLYDGAVGVDAASS